ncbi:threonine synthase [Geopsychrobacter electrodiphilus]|uniref:threonine synthase n=1 Tax=Geopsychrobacter electrodiphilus TaxID=225196 RepID=UPI00036DB43A|nr:threonine synthase [Geopsychrobacter electrodiphilus]
MKYRSTRGKVNGIPFSEAVMMGLADDGGLLLPESIPLLSATELQQMADLSYPQLALRVLSHYIDDIPQAELKELIDRSYATFLHPEVTPVMHKDGLFILELFHGPTLAFKDIALQLLGNLFEYMLAKTGSHMNIIGATSGDTGSAAIYGVRGKKGVNIFILHPKGKVSPIQEMQMTTVTDPNVFNIAVEGTFDDAQAIVKEIFGDLDYKQKHALGAVNSINWARVLAQVVYYFYAFFQVQKTTGCSEVEFSVPTGNFGDIFAGYVAKQMGLPIKKLILATNGNNILSRFVNSGDYSAAKVNHSLSPSMDIQVASNFERYLFYLYEGNSARICAAMETFKKEGVLPVSAEELSQAQQIFSAASITDAETLATIGEFAFSTGYILDPHTAVGVQAGKRVGSGDCPLICLATAHPAKFGEAVYAACGEDPELPSAFQGIDQLEKRLETLPADITVIKDYVTRYALS